jgi:hypothetical protein
MNKLFLSSLLLLGLSFLAHAEDWSFFSDETKDVAPHYGLALIAGSADLDKHDSSGDLYGLELSFVCPFVQASEHTIRQQLSLTKFHKERIDMYTLEANPHYLYQIESDTYFGIGPSFGLSYVDGGDDDVVATLGVGASLRKDMTDKLFLGAEFRTVYATDSDIDNVRVIGKIGYYFDK